MKAFHQTPFAALFAAGLCLASPVAAAGFETECCGDLQERVAELEAASARDATGAVSLTVSGEIARAMLIWDDGVGSDTSIIDDPAQDQPSKLHAAGGARVSQQWMTGFVIELGFTEASSPFGDQVDDQAPGETAFELRLANWYIEGEQFGRLTAGQQSSANEGITTIDLSRPKTDPVLWYHSSFGIRDKDGDYTGLIWGNVAWGLNGDGGDVIHYDSPVLYGFTASVAWVETESADAALRFQKELDQVRIAAGAGYLWVGDDSAVSLYPSETEIVIGSIAVLHLPAGLFGNAETGISFDGAATRYDDILLGYAGFSEDGTLPASIAAGEIAGTEVSRRGVGAVQQLDAASMEMRAVFSHFDAQIRMAQGGTEPWYGVVLGSRQNF